MLKYVSINSSSTPVLVHLGCTYFQIISLFRMACVKCHRLCVSTWDGTLSKFFPSIRLICLRACDVIWCLSRKENWQPSRMQWKWLLTWLYLQPAKEKTLTVVNSPIADDFFFFFNLWQVERCLRAAPALNALNRHHQTML